MFDSIIEWDKRLFVLLNQQWTAGWLDSPMTILTQGKVLQIFAVVLIIAVAMRLRLRMVPLLLGLLAAVAVTNSASDIVKGLVDRPRPFVTEEGIRLLAGRGRVASFPSSHAANGAAIASALIGLIGFATWRRKAFALGLVLLIGTIGWSRVYVGVHFPLDVLSGWFLGGALGAAIARHWRTHPPVWYDGHSRRLRWDAFHGAILVMLVLTVFRMAHVVTSDEGLTPGESVIWFVARYPLVAGPEVLGPVPAFLPLVATILKAHVSYEAFALRWVIPLAGFVSTLGVLYTMRIVGFSRGVSGCVILFLQSIPAVSACSVWFVETMFNGLPWVLALAGWAYYTIQRRPMGLALLAAAVTVACVMDFRNGLGIFTGLWLLEHFRGDYVTRPANIRSFLIGLGLLSLCLLVRFTYPLNPTDSLWQWSLQSVLAAVGPGSVLLGLAGFIFMVPPLILRPARAHIFGTRSRILLLYCLGGALASVWLGSKAHFVLVILPVAPGLILLTKALLISRMDRRRGSGPWRRALLPALVILSFGANGLTQLLIYDKDIYRRVPANRIEPRWTMGWPDRVRPLAKALDPEDRVLSPDAMTASALSHALRRPVGLLQVNIGLKSGGNRLSALWVDGTTSTLGREIVVMAPWSRPSLDNLLPSWQENSAGLGPAREGIPELMPLDKSRTVTLRTYQSRLIRPTPVPVPLSSHQTMAADPAAP